MQGLRYYATFNEARVSGNSTPVRLVEANVAGIKFELHSTDNHFAKRGSASALELKLWAVMKFGDYAMPAQGVLADAMTAQTRINIQDPCLEPRALYTRQKWQQVAWDYYLPYSIGIAEPFSYEPAHADCGTYIAY